MEDYYQHIQISKYRGIDNVTLDNLERINVFCGKNNSGKSTILKAIFYGEVSYGKIFQPDQPQDLYKKMRLKYYIEEEDESGGSFYIPMHNKPEELYLFELVESNKMIELLIDEYPDLHKSNEFHFFKTELNTLIESLGIDINRTWLGLVDDPFDLRDNIENDMYQEIFSELMKFRGKVHLIDAKRRLESKKSIQNNDTKSLIKHIFYLKNQRDEKLKNKYKKLKKFFLNLLMVLIFILTVIVNLS